MITNVCLSTFLKDQLFIPILCSFAWGIPNTKLWSIFEVQLLVLFDQAYSQWNIPGRLAPYCPMLLRSQLHRCSIALNTVTLPHQMLYARCMTDECMPLLSECTIDLLEYTRRTWSQYLFGCSCTPFYSPPGYLWYLFFTSPRPEAHG